MEPKVLARFAAKVDASGDGCWVWRASCDKGGYGQLSVGNVPRKTHRLAYEHFVGPIPPGLQVLHSCDNPPCVNPAHLRVGTQADNVRDMTERGRHRPARGEAHVMVKLTDDDVRAIRADPRAQRAIAAAYGIDHGFVCQIKNRKRRADVV